MLSTYLLHNCYAKNKAIVCSERKRTLRLHCSQSYNIISARASFANKGCSGLPELKIEIGMCRRNDNVEETLVTIGNYQLA